MSRTAPSRPLRLALALGLGAASLVAPLTSANAVRTDSAASVGSAASAPATLTPTRPKRGLTVQLILPAALKGKVAVTVTGPKTGKKKKKKKFVRTIRKTTSWTNAKPGTYRVSAPTVRLDGLSIRPTLSPSSGKVTVRKPKKGKKRGARVVVTYKQSHRCEASGASAWAWGDGTNGRLGNGTSARATTPRRVTDMAGVLAVTGGHATGYATCHDGTVWAWGYGGYGELGNGTTSSSSLPVRVSGLTRITGVAARDRGAVAVRDDGTVWSWGWGHYGQLGNGTAGSSSTIARTPVRVSGLTGVHAVAAGANTSYALKTDGTLWAWGNGGSGQLGNGGTAASSTPVQVKGVGGVGTLGGVLAVSAGNATAYALTNTLSVLSWGDDGRGQLGDGGTNTNRSTPGTIPGLAGSRAVVAGHTSAYALQSDGTVRSWGDDSQGQLGDGGAITNSFRSTPTTVVGLSGVRYLSSNGYTAYATLTNRTVRSWGQGNLGQLGNGTLNRSATPVTVSGLTGVVGSVSAGSTSAYAVRR